MSVLPALGQPWDIILYAGALLVALGVIIKAPGLIWTRIVKPFAKSVVEVDTVSQLAKVAPDLILLSKMGPVIYDMAQQFKTDSGSSLRDVINRLEEAAKANADALALNAEVAEKVAHTATATAEVLAAKADDDAAAVAATAKRAASAVAILANIDSAALQRILVLAQSSDATVTRIEDTNPVAPKPRDK